MEDAASAVTELLRNSFRPEFLNRLDEIIMFKPLTRDNITNMIDLMMAELNERIKDQQLSVQLTDAAKAKIAEDGFDPQFGARPLKRYLQKHVETLAARIILAGNISEGDTITIDVSGDTLVAR